MNKSNLDATSDSPRKPLKVPAKSVRPIHSVYNPHVTDHLKVLCELARDREAAEVGTPMEADPAVSETLAAVTAGGTKAGGVVQANMDIFMCDRDEDEDDWQDICDSRTRRGFAKAALASGGSGAGGVITMRDLWGLMSFAPCKAHDTVYTVAMVPKTSELVTRVRPTRAQRQAGKKRWKHVRVAAGGRQPRAGSGATRK